MQYSRIPILICFQHAFISCSFTHTFSSVEFFSFRHSSIRAHLESHFQDRYFKPLRHSSKKNPDPISGSLRRRDQLPRVRASFFSFEWTTILTLPSLPKMAVHVATFGFTDRIQKGLGCFTSVSKDQDSSPLHRFWSTLLEYWTITRITPVLLAGAGLEPTTFRL